jgi:hypothetical protein
MHTLKNVAAAVAIAMSAGVAQAAIIDGTNEPGELFVSVWDATAQLSYHLDLGITTAQLLANPSQTLVFNLFGDANYAGFLSPQSPLVFNIAGTDKVLLDLPDVPDFGLLVTSNDNVGSAIAGSWDSSTIASNGGNIVVHGNALNSVDTAGTCDLGSTNCSGIADPADGNAYHGANTWLSNFGGGLPFGNTAAVDTALGFWHLGTDENASVAIATQLPNDWILTGAGKLCYGGTGCSAPSQVPVPAAIWLFGSGLIGLVGIARRKATAAA